MSEDLGLKAERVDAMFGGHYWLRQRVWFWHRGKYERDGWHRSRSEGGVMPVMVKRCESTAVDGMVIGIRADIVAREHVGVDTGLGMIAMQETNKVLRHCAIGRVWKIATDA